MVVAKRVAMKRILIVEDDKEMQEIYDDMFRDHKSKYAAEITDNSVTAFGKLSEEKYDMVILDIIMEPVAGDILYSLIRDDAKLAEIPVLVISVLNPNSLDYIRQINNVSFLQKPITEEQLFSAIKIALGKEH